MTIVEGVEQAVGIFFGLIEPDDIILILVAQTVAEQTHGSVGIGEDKSSKVTAEKLRSGTNRNKIIVGAGVGDFRFVEPFFEGPKGSMPIGAIGHIGRYDPEFIDLEIILVEDEVGFETPIDGSKDRVPLEQIDRGRVVLREEELVRIAKELELTRMDGGFGRGCWDRSLPIFDQVLGFKPKS